MRSTWPAAVVVILAALTPVLHAGPGAEERPNILWFVVDDMSAHFSCYGETAIATPHVDRLARQGVRFTRAFATAPVCSSFRSALITGMYQTTIGAHHHRSGRGEHRIKLPAGVHLIPELFQRAGYHTAHGSGLAGVDHRGLATSTDRQGKTDYNFEWNPKIYDSHDWATRRPSQPFFMQVQLHGGKLRGNSAASFQALAARARQELGSAVRPEDVTLPPYYPRDPLLLEDWAAYLDSVRLTDAHVGKVLARLEQEGILDQTLVIFTTDHGISHARGKQFLYDEGTHIPLIIRGPGIPAATLREDLVEHIDIAALSLAAAGIPAPASMQARDILAAEYQPRHAVFAARDRCGETADRIRSVRTERWLYIRNHHPQRPLLQPSEYKDSKAIIIRLRELYAAGQLDAVAQQLLFAPSRPREELYEWATDRWQLHNVAADPAHRRTLAGLRATLDQWIQRTADRGAESPEVYAMEVADQLAGIRVGSPRHQAYSRNVELMKRWAAEGK